MSVQKESTAERLQRLTARRNALQKMIEEEEAKGESASYQKVSEWQEEIDMINKQLGQA